jgi:hypothetical protein
MFNSSWSPSWSSTSGSLTWALPPRDTETFGPRSDGSVQTQTLPFIAAEYEGRKVTIRRNPNYQVCRSQLGTCAEWFVLMMCRCQATVASVKDAFSSLRYTSDEILLFARFEEYNDVLQITRNLWPDLLPSLMLVKVALDRPPQQQHARAYVCSGMQSK